MKTLKRDLLNILAHVTLIGYWFMFTPTNLKELGLFACVCLIIIYTLSD